MKTVKITIPGSKVPANSLDAYGFHYKIKESYEIGTSLRGESALQQVDVESEEIIQYTTEENFQWLGFVDDISEVVNTKITVNRAGTHSFNFPETLKSDESNRSFEEFAKNKGIDIIVGEATDMTSKALANIIDGQIIKHPGLFALDKAMQLQDINAFTKGSKYLLLIHGTFSSTSGSFGKMKQDEYWNKLYNLYNGRVITLEHHTISKSPLENAIELIEALPDEIELDIISTSRGGLVADTLARCDYKNNEKPFTEDELTQMKRDKNGQEYVTSMRDINSLVSNKKIRVNKIVRVACPASGTTLLSKRLDHFLNFVINAITSAIGGEANIVVRLIKLLILETLKKRYDASIFPGLYCMVPGSIFQNINNSDRELSNTLISIAGDSEIGRNLWNSMKVVFTNLYYWGPNDFVVNTSAMTRGIFRRNGNYFFRFESEEIDHFRYFKAEKTREVIFQSLKQNPAEYSEIQELSYDENSRGIALKLVKFREVKGVEKVDKTKPVVVFLPGIMGSHLHHNGELKWLNLNEIRKGALPKHLQIDQTNVTSESAINFFYGHFKEYYEEQGFHVVIFSFDWRKSIAETAKLFDKRMKYILQNSLECHIVSHSMGGLVVKKWKQLFSSTWEAFKKVNKSKWIMLGTPWLGSYLVMEVLTGHAKRVKQLAVLDGWKITKQDIINIVNRFPGIIELFPIDKSAPDFSKKSFWENIMDNIVHETIPLPPEDILNHYRKHKKSSDSENTIKDEDKSKIFYIAGHKDTTVNGYDFSSFSIFNNRNYLKYTTTGRGDGSVTWDMGIPPGLDPSHLYYCNIEHTYLANKNLTVRAVHQIIKKGFTDELSQSEMNVLRGEALNIEEIQYKPDVVPDLYDHSRIIDNLFDVELSQAAKKEPSAIYVTVFNADLKWAKYPVMVGHFENYNIISAEDAVDRYLGGKLRERFTVANYPGKVGEQTVVFSPLSLPKGAIVIGLGPKDELTGYELIKTVKFAIIKYAILLRDNLSESNDIIPKNAISSLFVGDTLGKLTREESIRGILMGVHRANEVIEKLNTNLTKIEKVEFVDYYEDKAYDCYKILTGLKAEDNNIDIVLEEDIETGYGSRKRFIRRKSNSWWHALTTTIERGDPKRKTPYLKFSSYSGLANVSLENVYSNLSLAEYVTANMSQNSTWDKRDAKTIFELLLPNAYKDFIRNHRNIEWKMDRYSAQFPWEMFHDSNFGDRPTFVESGLIRQLFSTTASPSPDLINNNKALVIGDPLYNDEKLPQLPNALAEAKLVINIMEQNNVEVTSQLRSKPINIIKSFLSDEYKILHFAAHGIYTLDEEGNEIENRVGIAIGDNQFLNPGTIKQMSAIPEFVFINCCYSGKIVEGNEAITMNRHKLAANVGTQFIEIGAKAVIITGWAVNDAAAKHFASKFYKAMYEGDSFGTAVLKARRSTYENYKNTNTWGAYQCYGDQFYKLHRTLNREETVNDITLKREVILELENIISSSESVELTIGKDDTVDKIINKTKNVIQRADRISRYKPDVKLLEAQIYINIGHYQKAIQILEWVKNDANDYFDIGSLLQYYNIRSKELVRHRYDVNDNSRNYEKEMSEIVQELEVLSNNVFGDSYDRNNSLGSTFKRAGILIKDQRDDYFKKAANYYFNAAKFHGLTNRKSIYSVTSYINLSYLRLNNVSYFKKNMNEVFNEDINELMKKLEEVILSNAADRNNIYDQLANIQLQTTDLLINNNANKEKAEKVIQLYEQQISKCINYKNIVGEIEHMSFLENLVLEEKGDQKKSQHFNEIKTLLKKYL